MLASASKAIVIGFNVQADSAARRLADTEGVSIRQYDIIYRLTEDVEKALTGMLDPEEVETIIETAKKHGLNHILFEQNITPKVANVVQNEIGAESLRIHNLSVLTEEDIENGEDYFSLMRENLAKLKEALSE